MKTQIKRIVLVIAFATFSIAGVKAEVNSNLFAAEEEPELQIESWMTTTSFGLSVKDRFHKHVANHAPSMRCKMSLGNLHARSFEFQRTHAEALRNIFLTEQESELKIENWMSNDSSWGNSLVENIEVEDLFALEQDPELEIEKWMTEDYRWANLFARSAPGPDSFLNHGKWNKRTFFMR